VEKLFNAHAEESGREKKGDITQKQPTERPKMCPDSSRTPEMPKKKRRL